jgi:hypothetical protein
MNQFGGYEFADLRIGMSATFAKTITEADIVLFAAVSGDNNALHINAEYAATTIFETRIAHGMLSATVISAASPTTARSRQHHDRNPREAAAGAVPYLNLTGVVAGGWQMARAARIARDLKQAGESGSAFLRGKIATSRFYAEHVLPEAETWRLEVTAGAASTLALAEASF